MMSLSSKSKAWRSLQLDDNECLSLGQVLKVFSAPITEEHAWAVLYQTLRCLTELFTEDHDLHSLYTIASPADIVLHKDGEVHQNTFALKKPSRKMIKSENVAVADIGVAIYDSLDFGVAEDEQRTLSEELEQVIDRMVSADEDAEDAEDEGLGEECDAARSVLVREIMDRCRVHLALADVEDADTHFKGVCRALVAEALEISFFMTRLQDESQSEELEEEDMKQWASAWSQIMHQLRHGIKLRHVEMTRTAAEFSLTPYEMLMADIKAARYKLNHVERPGARVTSDARDKILEFIRSRPPLRPATARVLPPRVRKESTARELVLEQVRDGTGVGALRRIERRPSKNNLVEEMRRKRRHGVIQEESPVLSDPGSSSIVRRRQSNTSIGAGGKQTSRSSLRESLANPVRPKMRRKPTPKKVSLEEKYKTSLSFLSMSLAELSHIRSELTRADMEDKNLPLGLLTDVREGRTCFVCLKVNFGLVSWSYTCLLCLKLVCRGCCASVTVSPSPATRDPASVPVSSLLPHICADTPALASPSPSHLLRESFHRLAARTLTRSNTMGKEEEERVRARNSGASRRGPDSRARAGLVRANTVLEGSSLSRVVCAACREVMRAKMREMKRGDSAEHRKSLILH